MLGGYFSKASDACSIVNLPTSRYSNGPSLLGTSWWNENHGQFDLHIELAAVSDANVPARNGTRNVALCFGKEFRRVQPAFARVVVSSQSNIARHYVRYRRTPECALSALSYMLSCAPPGRM